MWFIEVLQLSIYITDIQWYGRVSVTVKLAMRLWRGLSQSNEPKRLILGASKDRSLLDGTGQIIFVRDI